MQLHGIFAPLTTPFAADGSLALTRLRENIARYNRTRLAGYVMNGSTGESVLLLWDEVYRVWEAAKEAAAPGKILIAGTGAESTAETIAHTSRAAALGFDAALVRTPSFYKPAINDDLLAEHYVRVADAARIPVLIYSVPVFTHVTVEASLIARVGAHPNIVGIKDSSGSVEGIAKIIAAAPKSFQALVGSAATLYDSLATRGRGRRDRDIERLPGDLRRDLGGSPRRRFRARACAAGKADAAVENAGSAIRHRRNQIRDGPARLLRRLAAPAPSAP